MKGVLLNKADPSIDYKPGVEVTLKLTKSLDWDTPVTTKALDAIRPAIALVTSGELATFAHDRRKSAQAFRHH